VSIESVVVKAVCYNPEGHGFETWLGDRIFSNYLILPAVLGLGVCSASNRIEYQKQKNNVSRDQSLVGADGWQITAICEPSV
jgi:hypothetical protein